MTPRHWVLVLCTAMVLVSPHARAYHQRDTQGARTGTARISGQVMTTDDTPRPVRRAIVSLAPLHSGDTALGHHAMTDDEGRFAFADLNEGRYNISAARSSFVTIPYGATMPQRTAAPIVVARGASIENVRVLLARGAVITGTIRDTAGDAVAGLDVRVETPGGAGPPVAVTRTDDQGVYRIFGLAAGSYVVSARPLRTSRDELTVPTDEQVDSALRALQSRRAAGSGPSRTGVTNIPSGSAASSVQRAEYVPVYHPATFIRSDAAPIAVRAGDERAGVDITLRMTSTATVSGQVLDTGGRNPTDIEVWLSKAGTAAVAQSDRTIMRADGTFRLSQVMPGRYLIAVRTLTADTYRGGAAGQAAPPKADSSCAFAAEDIQVTGADVTGLVLRLRPCLRVRGRVVFTESASVKPPSLSTVSVMLEAERTNDSPVFVPPRPPMAVASTGQFTLGEVGDVFPGRFRLKVDFPGREPGRGWWLESATAGDRDILDAPLEISATGPAVTEVVLTFTDRHSTLSGVLESATLRAPHEYTVVAFPTNQDWWRSPFRRVLSARPDFSGRYEMKDLPAGEYYVAALTDLVQTDLQSREFLSQLVGSAVRVSITAGEQKVQGLRIN